MNLLFLTDVYPYPPHQGSAVISYHWMRQLAPRHSISLVSLEEASDDGAAKAVEALGVSTLQTPFPSRPTRLARIRGTLSTLPAGFAQFDGRLWREWLQKRVREESIDMLVMIGARLSNLFLSPAQWPCPVLFNPFDSVALNLADRLRFLSNARHWRLTWPVGESPLRLAHYLIEYTKWARVEQHLHTRPQACIACTPRDAEAISARWSEAEKGRLHIISSGVDLSAFSSGPDAQVEGRLIFTGNMLSIDSQASAMWLLKAVFPAVKRALPEASLDIVGKDPPSALRKLASSLPDVRVTGYVPDIQPYMAAASVYVCPLLLGTGNKTRLLEALAMGKATVATSVSCHGLKVENERELIIADGREGFQRAIIDLLTDRQHRLALEIAARRAAERHHSWEAVGERVERLLTTLHGAGKAA